MATVKELKSDITDQEKIKTDGEAATKKIESEMNAARSKVVEGEKEYNEAKRRKVSSDNVVRGANRTINNLLNQISGIELEEKKAKAKAKPEKK